MRFKYMRAYTKLLRIRKRVLSNVSSTASPWQAVITIWRPIPLIGPANDSSVGSLFHQLSNSYKPRLELISRVWQRIDERRTSRLPRNLVLAVLYMLHVEFVMPEHQPKPISPRRRKVLECFGNWVTCACGCGREWNFAGGFDGLRRDQLKRKKCLPSKWKDAGPFQRRIMDLRQGTDRGPELYDQNRTNWLRGRQYAQSAEAAELW
jgi:hypothetical protein